MDHRTTTLAVVRRKRTRLQNPPPQWGVVRGMLHMRIKDAAAELHVPISYLRLLCRQNGFHQWPGKKTQAASQTFNSMDPRTTTMAVVRKKRTRLQNPPPPWGVVRGMLHMRIKDAAAELHVPISYLRPLCRQNGYPTWPGKTMRYNNSTGRNMMLQAVDEPEGTPLAGLAGPSQHAKIAQTKKKDDDNVMPGINKPVVNHPPREELVTLNLLDKVGSS